MNKNNKYHSRPPSGRQINQFTRRVIGKFPSIKAGKVIPFRSSLERDVLYLLELDPSVKFYTYDTPEVLCVLDGAYLQFRCDFEIDNSTTRKEQILIERASYSPKLYQTLRNAYEEKGLGFSVITEADVRTGARLYNSKLLFKYARQVICTNANIALSRFFTNRREGTIGELQEHLQNYGLNRTTVYTFLFLNYIQFTITEPLQETTTVWPAEISAQGAVGGRS